MTTAAIVLATVYIEDTKTPTRPPDGENKIEQDYKNPVAMVVPGLENQAVQSAESVPESSKVNILPVKHTIKEEQETTSDDAPSEPDEKRKTNSVDKLEDTRESSADHPLNDLRQNLLQFIEVPEALTKKKVHDHKLGILPFHTEGVHAPELSQLLRRIVLLVDLLINELLGDRPPEAPQGDAAHLHQGLSDLLFL